MSQIEEPFQSLLDNLAESDAPLRAAILYRLSDPAESELAMLKSRWDSIPVERRQTLLTRMVESSESNFELDFSQVARFALGDPDPEVRVQSISALWPSEQPEDMYAMIKLLRSDPVVGVQAAAAEGLGPYVLLGELGHLPSSVSGDAEMALLEAVHQDQPGSDVYCRALESLAYSSHHEVTDLIASIAQTNDIKLRATALLAMGRNSDSRWQPLVLAALSDEEPAVRFEAIRAAGEMGLTQSVTELIRAVRDSADREIQEMAIWSLGEIGGEEAQSALVALSNATSDEALQEVIEDAINMAALSLGDFGMYVMAPEDDDELMLEDLEGLDADEGDASDAS